MTGLSARDLTITFADTVGLDQVSVSVPTGTLVAVTGASGSGKTTLIQVLAGELRPTDGQTTWNDTAVDPAAQETPPAEPAQAATGQIAESAAATPTGWRFSGRFWGYTGFTALTMLGYATFGVLGYHLQVRHVVPDWQIPVIYATAMGIDALAALGSGWVYDRWGLLGLIVLPVLAAVVPFLSFATTPALVWAGALVWGIAMGVRESTMRAAVADLIPASHRGTGYGIFTAVYGLAWLGGGAIIGALYDTSMTTLLIFVVATQAAALAAFPFAISRSGRHGTAAF